MENFSIFDLMSDEEASKFKPEEPKKPQLTGALASDVQHQKEKGLQGEYAKGWEEAIGNEKSPESTNPAALKPASSSSQKKSGNVEKTAEYLSYRKLFCYAGKQHLIEDPKMSLEAIRKKFEKVYPELSKERTEMIYQPPVVPKTSKSKNDNDEALTLDFTEKKEVKDLKETEDLHEDSNDDNTKEAIEQDDNPDELNKSEGDERATDTKASECKELKLLPSIVDGKELIGLVIPVLKGSRKGACEEELERTFTSWVELIANSTVRNLLIAQDGTYEVRITRTGLFCARVKDGISPNREIAYDGFDLYVPKIPHQLLFEALKLFQELCRQRKTPPVEALVRFYFDGKRHFMWVPHQVVNQTRVEVQNETQDQLIDQQNIRVLEMHSHNIMSAFFSADDNDDEVATGLYAVVGRADYRVPHIRTRFSCGGHYREINYTDVFDMLAELSQFSPLKESVLEKWMDRIQIREDDERIEFE